jgi:hypothetical protein
LEILKDATQVLQRLQKVDGIGESTLVKMKEFIKDRMLAGIEAFKKDESRAAMKIMMHIFGESVLPEQRSFSMRDTKPFLKYTTM